MRKGCADVSRFLCLMVGGLAMGHSFVVNRKDLEYRNSFGAVVTGWGGDWENGCR